MSTTPDIALIREYLRYCPETGVITWKRDSGARKVRGRVAGTICDQGYVVVRLKGKAMKAHRLAWMLHHGPIPDGLGIDHVNGEKSDNRISNLRLATHAQNLRNQGRQRHNSSGFKGVAWNKCRGKWMAYITADGRRRHLGYFEAPDLAHAAYATEALRLHGEFRRVA